MYIVQSLGIKCNRLLCQDYKLHIWMSLYIYLCTWLCSAHNNKNYQVITSKAFQTSPQLMQTSNSNKGTCYVSILYLLHAIRELVCFMHSVRLPLTYTESVPPIARLSLKLTHSILSLKSENVRCKMVDKYIRRLIACSANVDRYLKHCHTPSNMHKVVC